MAADFAPRLDVLREPQRRLWNELGAVPAEFVLYGGTAIALHLGHRQSDDFDFFAHHRFDPAKLATSIPQITLKALSHFEDGTVRDLPRTTKDRLAKAAREVDLGRLPVFADRQPGPSPGSLRELTSPAERER